jgi:hypothetical protein
MGCVSYNGWKLAHLADGKEHEVSLGNKQGEDDEYVKGSIVFTLTMEQDPTSTIRIAPDGAGAAFAGAMGSLFAGKSGGEGAGGEGSGESIVPTTKKSTGGAALVGAAAGFYVAGPVGAAMGAAGAAYASTLKTKPGDRMREVGNIAAKAVGVVGVQAMNAFRGSKVNETNENRACYGTFHS